MCIHGGNKHLLRETIKKLSELGCRSLKTNPIADVGAWKEGGYGETISMDELFKLYLDYIPCYYEDGMPLSLQLGGFFSASPKRPNQYDIPSILRLFYPREKIEGRSTDDVQGNGIRISVRDLFRQ